MVLEVVLFPKEAACSFRWASLTACSQFPTQVSEMSARRWPPTKKHADDFFQHSRDCKTNLEKGHIALTEWWPLEKQLFGVSSWVSSVAKQWLTTVWKEQLDCKPTKRLGSWTPLFKAWLSMVHGMPSLGQKLYFLWKASIYTYLPFNIQSPREDEVLLNLQGGLSRKSQKSCSPDEVRTLTKLWELQ